MESIEHIGIAVRDLKKANQLFKLLFNSSHYKIEEVEEAGVTTSFFQIGDVKIELLEPSKEDSPIAKFLDQKGEGIHHIAVKVDDIKSTMKRLQNAGFIFTSNEISRGADNKLICFLHPKSTNGVLIELCQEIEE